jgi:hypothetical protein
VPIALKSGNLNLLEPSGSVKACNGITLPYFGYMFQPINGGVLTVIKILYYFPHIHNGMDPLNLKFNARFGVPICKHYLLQWDGRVTELQLMYIGPFNHEITICMEYELTNIECMLSCPFL